MCGLASSSRSFDSADNAFPLFFFCFHTRPHERHIFQALHILLDLLLLSCALFALCSLHLQVCPSSSVPRLLPCLSLIVSALLSLCLHLSVSLCRFFFPTTPFARCLSFVSSSEAGCRTNEPEEVAASNFRQIRRRVKFEHVAAL